MKRGPKPDHIPFDELETLFLDAGNTLVSMDFALIRDELERLGSRVTVADLQRAEAAARPLVSARIHQLHSTEGLSTFTFYLRALLDRLPVAGRMDDRGLEELVSTLRAYGNNRLWSSVLPGVPEALQALQEKALQLVVVSNSDGTVEEVLSLCGLRRYFDAVVDSHAVGFEKPDPRIFLHALQVAAAPPERTLHVGDLYHADVLGARAAGLHALLLDPFGDWPDVDCARLEDLKALNGRIAPRRETGSGRYTPVDQRTRTPG